jgi:hypothetical protein
MEKEDLPMYQKASFGQCICSPSCHFLFTRTSRAYACALILRSQKVEPQRTPDMIEEEEQAWEYFVETRDALQLFCLSGLIEQFQKHVEDFIQERLAKAAKIMAEPEKEEDHTICLHGL